MSVEKTASRWKLMQQQLWAFLNSSFGLFFLSSVVLSSVTWSYTQWSDAIEQRSANNENITKLNTEIDYRIRLIENYFASECTEGSNVDQKTLLEIGYLYSAGPKYRSIFPENTQKQLHVLIWEMSALQEDEGKKQDFVKSFEGLTRLYAYLNRFVEETEVVEETGGGGWSYAGPPDYWREVKKIQQCFSAATASIAQTLGFDRSSSPGAASSSAGDSDACSQLGSANPAAVQISPVITGEIVALASPDTVDISSAMPDLKNIEELPGLSHTSATAEAELDKPFLMAIEDVLSINGRGTVVTGVIERGTVKVGEEIEIVGLKNTQTATVEGLEAFRRLLDEGRPGERVGVWLRGIERKDVERGQVLATPGSTTPSTKFYASIYMLSKNATGDQFTLVNGFRPQFFIRTREVAGVIELPKGVEAAMPGDVIEIKIELETPIALENGLRFLIRAGGWRIGEGVVTKIPDGEFSHFHGAVSQHSS